MIKTNFKKNNLLLIALAIMLLIISLFYSLNNATNNTYALNADGIYYKVTAIVPPNNATNIVFYNAYKNDYKEVDKFTLPMTMTINDHIITSDNITYNRKYIELKQGFFFNEWIVHSVTYTSFQFLISENDYNLLLSGKTFFVANFSTSAEPVYCSANMWGKWFRDVIIYFTAELITLENEQVINPADPLEPPTAPLEPPTQKELSKTPWIDKAIDDIGDFVAEIPAFILPPLFIAKLKSYAKIIGLIVIVIILYISYRVFIRKHTKKRK